MNTHSYVGISDKASYWESVQVHEVTMDTQRCGLWVQLVHLL